MPKEEREKKTNKKQKKKRSNVESSSGFVPGHSDAIWNDERPDYQTLRRQLRVPHGPDGHWDEDSLCQDRIHEDLRRLVQSV